jgi:DNA-binding GntR family transcriptional regulator
MAIKRHERPPAGPHRPRYSEIEDILREEIQSGVFKLGSRLPTEHELCDRFGVSRFTVRQALSRLREAGILDARPGIGTIVVSAADRVTFIQTLSSMEELLQYPAETYRQHLSVTRIEATPEQAVMLRCSPGQRWVRLKAMRLARPSNAPIASLDAYLLPKFAGVVDLPNPAGTSVVRQIEQLYGHRAAHAQIEIFVSRIDPLLADPLMVEEGDPALIILRRYRDDDGVIFLVTYSVHPENRFSLNIELEKHAPLGPFN